MPLNLAAVKVGPVRYNSPWTQVAIIGFVTFCSVGMFSAVSGLGAGGTQDTTLSDTANGVLYGCFAIGGLFAGSVNNVLGPRMTLSIGTMGYSLYIGGLWAFQVHGTRWFLILAGAILGFTAALLWAAQGAIMMSYPMEKDKGRSFTLFWAIFQLGTIVGASITLGIEAHSELPGVSTGVYLAFMIIMLTSIFTSWLLLPPHSVVRGDGTVVELEDAISPHREIQELWALCKDWRMIALFPMFFSSNYFYAYQGAIVTVLFNGRTRALVSLLEGVGQVVGSLVIGQLTDNLPFGRRKRALTAAVFVILFNCFVWAAGLGFQVQFKRGDTVVRGEPIPWDWTVGVSVGPIILLMAYYMADATYQGLAYYTMSSLTNEPFKLARMAGYYKGVQSAGAAVSFGMDAVKTAYLGEHLVSWLMLLVSLPLCFWVLWGVRDTNYDVEHITKVEDLSDGAIEGVALPPGHVVGEHLHENNTKTAPEVVTGV
ncbi:MFS general substrate transporter [Cryphonectria parasitica EP155]|uniref:MFS general substrate transporter n=1 Tax=Cryphonectria parasitica (strain ATCC 38755 / EP155) TaxID=660469 RepID=A0A9P4Y1S0_CRYP1|nr:MFS general substrate transporter [Cryphonectria parasitica EP155]KAF3765382.1 MFS general substrate transporter [Cryphonectria parasitica EP155]